MILINYVCVNLRGLYVFQDSLSFQKGGLGEELRRVPEVVRGPGETMHSCAMATNGDLAQASDVFVLVFELNHIRK